MLLWKHVLQLFEGKINNVELLWWLFGWKERVPCDILTAVLLHASGERLPHTNKANQHIHILATRRCFSFFFSEQLLPFGYELMNMHIPRTDVSTS